jgi:N-acetylglucosamine-6-phosphate deacetylase
MSGAGVTAAPKTLVYTGLVRGSEVVPGTAVIEDGILVELCYGRHLSEPWAKTFAIPEGILLPGLIDIHLHGGGGHDAAAGRESLRALGHWLASRGVTGFLASVAPRPWERLLGTVRTIAEATLACDPPNLLGLHLEGPFISQERAGALAPGTFRLPDIGAYRALRAAAGPALKVLTLAPELPGASEVIGACGRDGVVAALGHADATYEEARQGFGAGLSHVTHLYNAMSPFHHRAPGAVGASLASDSATVELIMDGQHLHPLAANLARSSVGPPRVVLVSDSVPAAGTTQGVSVWEGREVFRRGARLVLADGTLAGSSGTLIEGLASLIAAGWERAEALAAATVNPARVLGLASRKGMLLPGFDADMVVVDRNWRVLLTLAGGRQIWPRQTGQEPSSKPQS